MKNNNVYVTPNIDFWSAQELDKIEAKMSGGSGGGGNPNILIINRSNTIIPNSTDMVTGSGVVSDGLITFEVLVSITGSVFNANKSITWRTTSPSIVATLVRADTTTNAYGMATASFHLRNNATCNPSFIAEATIGSLTGRNTIQPNVPTLYDSLFYCTWYITCDENEKNANGTYRYTGAQTTKPGLGGKTYKADFLADVVMNGSGRASDGSFVKYVVDTWSTQAPTTAIGTTPEPNKTIAVDYNMIPRNTTYARYGHIRIVSNSKDYKAEDSGGAINAFRIDIYHGYGHGFPDNFYSAVQYKGINTWGAKNHFAENDMNMVNILKESEFPKPKVEWYSNDDLMCGYINKQLTLQQRLTITVIDRKHICHDLEMGSAALHLEDISFYDDDTVAIEAYINPSLRERVIFDLTSNKKKITHYGYGFAIDGDDIYYVQAPQHFCGIVGSNRLVKNDEVIMETPKNVVIYGNIVIDTKTINITIRNENGELPKRQDITLDKSKIIKSTTNLYYKVVIEGE